MTTSSNQLEYNLKQIVLKDSSQSILLQNQNGPCALIAIANVLVLRDSPMAAYIAQRSSVGLIDEQPLLAKLGDCINANISVLEVENVFEFLPKMSKGLDVNPKFDGSFCKSPELDVFNAFGIKLVHGWVLGDLESDECSISFDDTETYSQFSYEQICAAQFSDQPITAMAKFVEQYPTQMTPSGLLRLQSKLEKDELAVLFWNNHFSTIVRHNDEIYSLVIDLGFQENASIVWEQLSLGGAGRLLDGTFNENGRHLSHFTATQTSARQISAEKVSTERNLHQKSSFKNKSTEHSKGSTKKKISRCKVA